MNLKKCLDWLGTGFVMLVGLAAIAAVIALLIYGFQTGDWEGRAVTRRWASFLSSFLPQEGPTVGRFSARAASSVGGNKVVELEPPAEALCIPEHKSATLYRAESGRLVWTSFGYVEEVRGTREIQSTAGVDWEVVEECNLLLLYNIGTVSFLGPENLNSPYGCNLNPQSLATRQNL